MAAAICTGLVCPGQTSDVVNADVLLRDVISRLPQEPLDIEGSLLVRRRRGVEVGQLRFHMFLHWGAQPSVATYTIRDNFGRDLERMTVTRASGASPHFRYARGNPPVEAALPGLTDPIQDSDLTWMDLTLSFLWWKGGCVRGEEVLRGRPCYIVDVPAPDEESAGYSSVRLWIDRDVRMLLQAEARGADGRPMRRLWVKSMKRVNERWMIKDMEVQSVPAVHRTKLTVEEVTEG